MFSRVVSIVIDFAHYSTAITSVERFLQVESSAGKAATTA